MWTQYINDPQKNRYVPARITYHHYRDVIDPHFYVTLAKQRVHADEQVEIQVVEGCGWTRES